MKILMVCLGNICRSPIAEGVMREKFRKYNLTGDVDSAGVLDFHEGEAPDSRAILIAQKYNVDISKQVARKFKISDLNKYDLILTMDDSVHKSILQIAGDHHLKNRVFNFLSFAGNPNLTNVPDPYYGGPEGFEKVFDLIDESCEKIMLKLQKSK